MVLRRTVVLVDTNVIIESFRTGCWSALAAYFTMETVEKCCEEARTGRAHRPGYVKVDARVLNRRLTVHPVSDRELLALSLRDVEAFRLDPGERRLWAHALGRSDVWVASSADRAAINAAVRLGWEDRLVSLEELTNHAGARSALKHLKGQFGSARLSTWRTAALLDRGLE